MLWQLKPPISDVYDESGADCTVHVDAHSNYEQMLINCVSNMLFVSNMIGYV